ncbi:MAG: DUF58 domain-containing protein [Pirellulales bacterium]|nr:DUF58 domain-containing protein [Pirellulales bacterium]
MLAREVIQRVREIQIHTGRQVADVLAGQYVSVFKGRGIEFDEVRPYVPGDDVRTIDWNVTARMGHPYVKRYVEERQLTLMLMADVSASQDFGSAGRSKREATAELCALLAFSATRNDDKVGLTLFHGGIEQYIPARKGQKHSLRVVREVLAHGSGAAPEELAARGRTSSRSGASDSSRPGKLSRIRRWLPLGLRRAWWRTGRQATNVAGAMQFLMSVTTRKAVCFVVSDFLDEGYLPAMRIANRKHDVIAVLITDPRELEIPNVGLLGLADAESGKLAMYDTGSAAFRRELARLAHERVERLKHAFRASDIDFIHIDASGSLVDPVVRFFRMRERRMRR